MLKEKSQTALEYLVIVGAVVVIAGIVTYLVAGSAGTSQKSVSYSACRQAATQCGILKAADPNANCSSCYEQCVDPVNGSELFTGAIDWCLQGNSTGIFEGSSGCTAGCTPTETTETTCDDGVDNDCDGLIDCADYNCAGNVICEGIPFANFTYSCYENNGTCDFNASSSNDPDGNIVSYSWDFGDGATGTGVTISHTFNSGGDYVVSLIVEDNDGNTNSSTSLLNIPPYWHIEEIGESGSGYSSSLVLDSNDYPHITYTYLNSTTNENEIKYKWFDGNVWHTELVNNSDNYDSPSLALDSNGLPHISYSASGSHLIYSWFDGNAWHGEVLYTATNGVQSTSLVLDSNDYPHIAICYNPMYFWFDGSAWNSKNFKTEAGSGGCDRASIALNSSDSPFISFNDAPTDYDFYYAYLIGTVFHNRMVDSSDFAGEYSSLKLDSNNNVHISYYVGNPSDDLKYYEYSQGTEALELASFGGKGCSVALDSNNFPHISYYDGGGNLKHAWKNTTGWNIETVGTGYGPSSSLALDSNDYPHISYYDGDALGYAYYS